MIVLHELPFRFVEYVGFRRFVASLNPAFKLMSRTTIRDECIAEFNRQKVQLQEVLKNLNSRVSLTADLWTSNQELGYICVTCHFVDNKWNLHKKIINFCHVETPHNATNLLNVMLKTMEDWGIDDKICSITLDNAAVNDLMVSYIKGNLIGRRLLIKRKFKEMFNAYSSDQNVDSIIPNQQEDQASSSNEPWANWSQHVGQQRRKRSKQSEYDMYLKDELVPPDVNLDVLEWWRVNGHKYPTISRMARDVLAVPASTVASESAFSTGSRVISDYRSRLASKTVTALICLQDWMRPSGVIDATTIVEDLVKEDEHLLFNERSEAQVEP